MAEDLDHKVVRISQQVEKAERSASRRFGSLETSVSQLRTAHQQTRTELAETKRTAEKAESGLRKASKRTDEGFELVTRQLDDVRSRLDELADAIDKLDNRSSVLERQIRQGTPAGQKAELDNWLARHTELGFQVYQGREAAGRLQAMTDVQTLHNRIEQHERNLAAHRHHRDQAIAAARELAALDPAVTPGWERPVLAWTTSQRAFAKLSAELESSHADARQAQAELESTARRTAELAVESGELAENMLRQHIHDHLDTVLADDPVLPAWLANALGAGPSRTYLREWINTAVGIMAYRVVYQITSQLDPVGPRPLEPGVRRAHYDELKRDCERYRL